MASVSSILKASLTGSVEFLVLNGAGTFIAYLGHWNDRLAADLSSSIFKVFLPALVFGPVLRTSHTLKQTLFDYSSSLTFSEKTAAIQQVTIPFTYSVLLLSLTTFLFSGIVQIIGRGKHPFVRALAWSCLVLGNTTSLPVVIMKALCRTLPNLSSIPTCSSDVTAYSAIFLIPQIVFTWAVAFPYLQSAAFSEEFNTDGEIAPLLPTTTNSNPSSSVYSPTQRNETKSNPTSFVVPSRFMSFCKKLCNPPVITIFVAGVMGFFPWVPNLFLSEDGALKSVLTSLDTVGTLAVTLSAVIVGAEVYRALLPSPSSSFMTTSQSFSSLKSEFSFGTFLITSTILIRMVIFPLLGQTVYSTLNMRSWFVTELLGLFVVQQTNLTTASSILIMVSMLQKQCAHLPFVKALKKDVAIILFIQFCIAPVFLTLNTALSISVQFN